MYASKVIEYKLNDKKIGNIKSLDEATAINTGVEFIRNSLTYFIVFSLAGVEIRRQMRDKS